MSTLSETDSRHMARAIVLSKRGFPAPNPHVGCVLAHGPLRVGEGYHHYAGAPHAEIEAIKSAGVQARGATAYVTLEPCNHFGRTPPCSKALIEAGVTRVVVACPDPNPVASGGLQQLADAGVQIEVGLHSDLAAEYNVQFLTAMTLQRPFFVVKVAASLDGRISLPNGESKWITGPAARRRAHYLRAQCGAVLVGRKTVEMDNPMLTARIPKVVNQPVRIVLDPSHRLDSQWNVFNEKAPSIHVVDGALGLHCVDGLFDLKELGSALFAHGIRGVLVEGGAHTAASFIKAGLADRIEMFLAPKILGSGPSWIEGLVVNSISDAPGFRIASVKKLSGDLQITLTR